MVCVNVAVYVAVGVVVKVREGVGVRLAVGVRVAVGVFVIVGVTGVFVGPEAIVPPPKSSNTEFPALTNHKPIYPPLAA